MLYARLLCIEMASNILLRLGHTMLNGSMIYEIDKMKLFKSADELT